MSLSRLVRSVAAVAVAVSAAVVAPGLAGTAGAAVTPHATPAFEPDANALGTVTLYDASGNVITSGTNDATSSLTTPFAAYALGTAARSASDDHAQLALASPVAGQDPSTWSVQYFNGATAYPNSGAPGALKTTAQPVYSGTTDDNDLVDMTDTSNGGLPASAYPGIYELRIYTSHAGSPRGSAYDRVDLSVNTSTGAWQVVYPQLATTASTVGVSPDSPATSGATETLTATVTPAGVAGTVQFLDGSTAVGSAATYTQSTGAASLSTVLPDGTHSLTAQFTPSDTTAVAGATSATATSYTVGTAATTPTSTVTSGVSVSPTSPAPHGTQETLTATVTPATAAGSVTFSDNSTTLPGTVSYDATSGTATLQTTLADGSHSLSAAFTPTDATAYTSSSSTTASSYTVSPAAAATSTTTANVSVSPAGPAPSGTQETLSTTIAPTNAAGTVTFSDGATALTGTVNYTASTGAASLSLVLPAGTHSLTASFTPTDATAFGASTSAAATSYTVSSATTGNAPPYEPDPNTLGAITLYDAAGNVITGGTNAGSAPFAAYAQGLKDRGQAGDNKAILALASPVAGQDPSTWPRQYFNSATTYPNASAPAALASSALPLYSSSNAAGGEASLNDLTTGTGSLPASAYPGIYELRIYTSGPGHTIGSAYDSVDLQINNSTGAWSVIYPSTTSTTTPTTTSDVTVDQQSPVASGTTETLTATVTPTGVAGTFAFLDGSSAVSGTPTYDPTTGKATLTVVLAPGSHSLVGSFTPGDSSFAASSSPDAVAFTVSQPAATSVVLTAAPAPAAGATTTLTATVTPTAAAGSIEFLDGSMQLAYTAVIGGVATDTVSLDPTVDHKLTATFIPTDSTQFQTSNSNEVDFVGQPVVVVTPPTPAPVATTLPHLSGKGSVDATETCVAGAFTNATGFTYTFSVAGKTVQGPSAKTTIVLTAADYNKALSCTVTASGPGGTGSAASQSVKVKVGPKLTVHKATTIKGTAKVGKKLTLKIGTWSHKPKSYKYQWKRNGKNIKGATKSSYVLKTADRGAKITCTLTAVLSGYSNGSSTTKAVKAV